jgi:hypothetical protein
LRPGEAFERFEEQRKLLVALATDLQVVAEEVVRFFGWPPLQGPRSETAQLH